MLSPTIATLKSRYFSNIFPVSGYMLPATPCNTSTERMEDLPYVTSTWQHG